MLPFSKVDTTKYRLPCQISAQPIEKDYPIHESHDYHLYCRQITMHVLVEP